MRNRNDQKRFIFAEQKKLQVQRLYKKITQISQRKRDHIRNLTQSNFKYQRQHQTSRYPKTPINQDQIRIFQIHKQNKRLVDRLGSVKSTVYPHIIVPKKEKTVKLKQIVKNRIINEQNERLAKVIMDMSVTNRKKF